jgi:hypothetical protein
MLVPSTICAVQPVQSPALPQDNTTIFTTERLADRQSTPAPIIAQPKISTFIEKFIYLARNLPNTIPEASDNDKFAEFGGDPVDLDDITVDKNDLWEEEINPRLKRVLGWGTEEKMEDLVRRGRNGVEGLAIYMKYCVEERGVDGSLFEGKLSHLMSALEAMYVLKSKSLCEKLTL